MSPVPDPRGERARKARELLIAAFEFWRQAQRDQAQAERHHALMVIATAIEGPLFDGARPEFERYVREQLASGERVFWSQLAEFTPAACVGEALARLGQPCSQRATP